MKRWRPRLPASDGRKIRRRQRQPVVVYDALQATARALDQADRAESVVLVEGVSDQIAVETLARCRGRDLADEGISVVPMGGAHAIGVYLARFGPEGAGKRLAGLCDVGEEQVFADQLTRAGFGPLPRRADMERLGFYVCDVDLEDELIRATGPESFQAVLEAHDELDSFRVLQRQPPWRGRPIDAQLHRFLRSMSYRKTLYARLLIEALDPADVPRPLAALVDHV